MTRIITFSLIAFSTAAATCFAQSIEPVGPSGWPLRSWIGLLVQITLFVLAVFGVYKLAGLGRETRDEGRGTNQRHLLRR